MKLRIKARGHNIFLLLPTSILKSRLAYSLLQRAVTREVDERAGTQSNSVPITRKQYLELYKAIKQCIKENGHFNLIEVESKEGEKVLIRV